MFTAENTEGAFAADELETLNSALKIRMGRMAEFQRSIDREPDSEQDEKNASDLINNAWFEGAAVADMIAQ